MMDYKRPKHGHMETPLDETEFDSEKLSKFVGIDFAEVFTDKEVMELFALAVKHKERHMANFAHKKNGQKFRNLTKMERYLILAKIFNTITTRRKRVDEFRQRHGETKGYLISR
jgi:hypothetical protein